MIVFSAKSNIPVYNGLSAAFTACQLTTISWDSHSKPIFDMLEEVRPSYLFLSSKEVTPAMLEAIPQYDVKVVLYGVNIPDGIADKVSMVITPPNISPVIAKNIPKAFNVKKAANIVQFSGGYYNEKMSSDILYITNSATAHRAYIPMCISGMLAHLQYRVKVIGPYKIPVPQYLGTTNNAETLNFVKSAKVILDYDFDVVLDIVANKSFAISNIQNSLVPSYSTEYELVELLDKYINNEKLRRKTVKVAYNTVIENDTYFHRMKDIASYLGEDEWKTLAETTLGRYKK